MVHIMLLSSLHSFNLSQPIGGRRGREDQIRYVINSLIKRLISEHRQRRIREDAERTTPERNRKLLKGSDETITIVPGGESKK